MQGSRVTMQVYVWKVIFCFWLWKSSKINHIYFSVSRRLRVRKPTTASSTGCSCSTPMVSSKMCCVKIFFCTHISLANCLRHHRARPGGIPFPSIHRTNYSNAKTWHTMQRRAWNKNLSQYSGLFLHKFAIKLGRIFIFLRSLLFSSSSAIPTSPRSNFLICLWLMTALVALHIIP